MSTIDQLIDELSRDLPRVSRHALPGRVAVGVLAGAAITLVLVAGTLGLRPDLGRAMQGPTFWMKWTYTASLAAVASYGVLRLARPALAPVRALWLLLVPVLALAAASAGELARTPRSEWLAMWLGRSWLVCPWLVLGFSVPIFAGLLWSFRRLAPTRLRAAGAVAGLCAGAWAAMLYCLHCPEVSALFVLTWYSLGIGLAAALGALVGPRFLHW